SVGGLPLAWYGIFAFIAQLVAIPAAYLIGREIANSRVGLFAAMLTLFSVFFFLPTIPLPSLFGFVFLFMAIYALIRVRGPGWQGWFAIFWISALGAGSVLFPCGDRARPAARTSPPIRPFPRPGPKSGRGAPLYDPRPLLWGRVRRVHGVHRV